MTINERPLVDQRIDTATHGRSAKPIDVVKALTQPVTTSTASAARQMSVLQCPVEIAGQAALSAHGLREIGVDSTCFLHRTHPFGYDPPEDSTLWFKRGRLLRTLEMLIRFPQLAYRHNVIHYHFGAALLPRRKDVRIFQKLNKRVLVEFWGSDVRLPSVEAERNPHFVNARGMAEENCKRTAEAWSALTGGEAIIADASFLVHLDPFFDKLHIVRQRIDTCRYVPRFPSPEQSVPTVFHAPSHQGYKGSEVVQNVVDKLRRKKLRFNYREVHGRPHREVLDELAGADIVVDQVRLGSHGIFALEAMAMGKPVICYILPELLPTYPEGFPIINADPDNLEQVLEHWITCRPDLRHKRGITSRRYVEQVHDCRKVAKRLVDVYARTP